MGDAQEGWCKMRVTQNKQETVHLWTIEGREGGREGGSEGARERGRETSYSDH